VSRAATATIDLAALRHNFHRARNAAPGCRIAATIKANAYGHGLIRIARALPEADAFAVACIEEAIMLREAGIKQPILLLEGVYEAAELDLCSRLSLEIAVHDPGQLTMLEHARLPAPLRVWLKIDSGMHRLGFDPEQAMAAWRRLRACPAVSPKIGLMSHLANADDRNDGYTLKQLEIFQTATAELPGERSLANSAAVLGWPRTHCDCVRPGLMLYGASPFTDTVAAEEDLLPVMTLSTRLIAIKRLRKGEPVGYGGSWICPEDMDIGIAAIGYGDGYPRQLAAGAAALVNGRSAELAGRVSMDMISLDLRQHPAARVGDPVILWGRDWPIERIAHAAGTIPYTLLCGVTRRVHFQTQGVAVSNEAGDRLSRHER